MKIIEFKLVSFIIIFIFRKLKSGAKIFKLNLRMSVSAFKKLIKLSKLRFYVLRIISIHLL